MSEDERARTETKAIENGALEVGDKAREHDPAAQGGWTLKGARDFLSDGGYDVGAFALILTSTGIPIPPTVIGRVRKGLGRLVDSSFDLATSKIDRIKRRADFEQEVQHRAVAVVAAGGAGQIANSPAASDITIAMVREFSRKWENQAAVAKAAFEELEANPPKEDPAPDAELDEDWLNYFADVAAQKSSDEMRRLMGRILAGEIRKPGSFSPLTIHTLSTLSQPIARKFEDLCSIAIGVGDTFFLPQQAYPEMLGKGIPDLEITYYDIMSLQAHSIISPAIGSGMDVADGNAIDISFGNGRRLIYIARGGKRRVGLALFTPMGLELLSLISPKTRPELSDKLKAVFPEGQWELLFQQ